MDETILVRAAERAADRMARAVDLIVERYLEAHAQAGNLRQVVGKSYADLTRNEIQQLAAIYHRDDEPYPCQFCRWIATEEMKLRTKEK